MSKPNWHKIADLLAERLLNHYYCVNGHKTTAEGKADDDCAYCADMAAYDAYVKAGGTVRESPFDGEMVAIQDLIARDDSGEPDPPDASTFGAERSGDA